MRDHETVALELAIELDEATITEKVVFVRRELPELRRLEAELR